MDTPGSAESPTTLWVSAHFVFGHDGRDLVERNECQELQVLFYVTVRSPQECLELAVRSGTGTCEAGKRT